MQANASQQIGESPTRTSHTQPVTATSCDVVGAKYVGDASGVCHSLRPAGVFSRTRPALGGGAYSAQPNSRTNRRSEAGEAAIESPEREDSNAY